jgi:predicted nucleic acid-binding protein
MIGSKFLLDTSAWIEYFQGTPLGQTVRDILDKPENVCFVCGGVVSELASTLIRNGLDHEKSIEFVKSRCTLLEGTFEDYFACGVLHARLKKTDPRVSYTDTLLITLGEKHALKIVSKDAHLKGYNTLFLR